MDDLLVFLGCIVGVSVVSAVVYFFYNKILIFIGGLFILMMGIFAYYLIVHVGLPWILAILLCGLMAGILCVPSFLISDVEALKKRVGKPVSVPQDRSSLNEPSAPKEKHRSKANQLVQLAEQTIQEFNQNKEELEEALASKNEADRAWAADMINKYAERGIPEAKKMLQRIKN